MKIMFWEWEENENKFKKNKENTLKETKSINYRMS